MAANEQPKTVTMKGDKLTLSGPVPKVGDMAPDFVVVTQEFKPVKLSEFRGKTVLLSAVPSLDTSVCAISTKRFNEAAEQLPQDVEVLTISEDLPFAQNRFCGAEGIQKIRVLSDSVHRDFGQKFGILIKEIGLLARSVWVVDPEGKIKYVEIVPEITDHPNYEAALAQVKK